MSPRIDFNRPQLVTFCERWGVAELSLFGSILRPDFSTSSDIDVLVSFKKEAHPTLFDFVRMREELGQFFNRPVDLVSRRGLERSANYLRRTEILSTAQPLYAAAA